MTNFLNNIKKKIVDEINPENISLIDNTHLHTKHKSFVLGKHHLKIIIKSKKLKQLTKIKAHRVIFSILKYEMKNYIHALEIEIN
jgi:BolA family transcriptional regulator, general stress-responsive regulator